MKRVVYTALYVLFALVVPLLVINTVFPFGSFVDAPLVWKFEIGGFLSILIAFIFFRKHIVKWAKGFDRVTWFRGIIKWIIYVLPSFIFLFLMLITSNYGQNFLFIAEWTFISHLIAGVFMILAEKAKVKNFKKWVNK